MSWGARVTKLLAKPRGRGSIAHPLQLPIWRAFRRPQSGNRGGGAGSLVADAGHAGLLHLRPRVHAPSLGRGALDPSPAWECSPPGSDMPHKAVFAAPLGSSERAMSPIAMMPTRRLSRLTTGNRRTLREAMLAATSSTS